MPKPKEKEKSKRMTFYIPPNLLIIWNKLKELGYSSNADLFRDMIREFAKKRKVL